MDCGLRRAGRTRDLGPEITQNCTAWQLQGRFWVPSSPPVWWVERALMLLRCTEPRQQGLAGTCFRSLSSEREVSAAVNYKRASAQSRVPQFRYPTYPRHVLQGMRRGVALGPCSPPRAHAGLCVSCPQPSAGPRRPWRLPADYRGARARASRAIAAHDAHDEHAHQPLHSLLFGHCGSRGVQTPVSPDRPRPPESWFANANASG